jgi:hypothetical protein
LYEDSPSPPTTTSAVFADDDILDLALADDKAECCFLADDILDLADGSDECFFLADDLAPSHRQEGTGPRPFFCPFAQTRKHRTSPPGEKKKVLAQRHTDTERDIDTHM